MKRQRLKHLQVIDWPERDREAFFALFEKGDGLFDNTGPLSHVSGATKTAYTYAFRRWLGYLRIACPECLSEAPVDRMTPERIRSFGKSLTKTCGPHTTADYLRNLLQVAWSMEPTRNWAWFEDLCCRLKQSASGRPSRALILVTAAETLDLGIRLMGNAWRKFQSDGKATKNTLLDYRDGLIIAVLSCCPMRRRNITSIVLGENLIRQSGKYIVCFGRHETKTRCVLQFELHEELSVHIDRYLEHIRLCFPGAAKHSMLFTSCKGGRLGGDRMNIVAKQRTEQAFGTAFTVHDFRRIAATKRSVHDPANIALASQLLGHADISTTQEHYIFASSVSASRTINKIIEKKRPEATQD
ncbi:MAG: tyrosine-type recombinase/integrase [Hyphomicrobiales bacterium]